MEYTEEIKKEADSVVINIISKIKKSLGSMVFSEFGYNHIATTLAIQDRQSVLDLAKVAFQTASDEHDEFWLKQIQSLTKQINYLKNKL